MTARVSHLWRHPVKGIGCEALDRIDLTTAQPMPGDRAWALLHQGGAETDAWQPRRNFLVVAYGPKLAQIGARTLTNGTLELTHPDLDTLLFNPATDGPRLIDWVRPLWPEQHSTPHRLVRSPAQGMADNGSAQVSLMNHASLRAVSHKLGQDLDQRRFRGNIWVDGLAPWEEFNLVGKTIRVGGIQLKITAPIERCRATEANPITGQRDTDPVKTLSDGWGHRDFGVYATILSDGLLSVGDEVTAL